MQKKIWIIIAIIVFVVIIAAVLLLRLGGGSHTAIDQESEADVQGNSHILVAYFSWSGNDQQMARWIAEETGGDLFRILTKEPYGDDFDTTASRAQSELNSETRPELLTHIDKDIMAQYDVIYLSSRFGGMICRHRYGHFWKNMIYQEKRLCHFSHTTEALMVRTV